MILLNGTKLDFETFPNGETKVNGKQILDLAQESANNLTLKYESDVDIIRLMLTKRFLDTTEARYGRFTLRIIYMPYSRMDRVEGNSVFTLKYIADFINSLKFDEVYVVEPHSDVTMGVLDNAFAEYPTKYLLDEVLREIDFNTDNDYLFFPDAGAQKRYHDILGYKSAVGYKHRNFETGKIESFQVIGNLEDLRGKKVLIVDDLCSYGGTFLASAGELKKLGVAEVYLLVGHCEESIYKGNLLLSNSPVSKIFTTNSIINDSLELADKLKIYNII